jgi:hypothetical protein
LGGGQSFQHGAPAYPCRHPRPRRPGAGPNLEIPQMSMVEPKRICSIRVRKTVRQAVESALGSQCVAIRLTGCPTIALATTCRADQFRRTEVGRPSAGVDHPAPGYSPIAKYDFRLWPQETDTKSRG